MIKFESIEDTEVFKAIVVSPSPYESKEIGDSIAKIAPKIIANVKDNANSRLSMRQIHRKHLHHRM